MSESVKELEDRVLKEDPELFCKATFWTIMGLQLQDYRHSGDGARQA